MTREEAVKELIDMANMLCLNPDTPQGIALKMAIKALEQESKTGHWICTIEDWNKWTCSECGFCKRTDIHISLGYNYCPNCGAKMVEPQESADV